MAKWGATHPGRMCRSKGWSRRVPLAADETRKEVREMHFNLSLRLPKAVVIQVIIVITVIFGVSAPLAL